MAEETAPGRLVGGRYRLVEEVAEVDFGRVWQARDSSLGVDVAVKEVRLHPGITRSVREDMVRRATREAGNAARLRDHPNIVTVHDVVFEDGVAWMVMQFVSGRSLQERVSQQGPLKPDAAEKVARAVLKALQTAHGAGIVHRDVNPANVLLADDGEILLTGFGSAVLQRRTRPTAPGSVIGAAEYLAPERIRDGDEKASGDLFSLGATLFFAVEGVSPFHRDSPEETFGAILADEAPNPQHAGRLAPLIERLLLKDRGRRATVARALELVGLPPTKVATAPRTLVPPTAKNTGPARPPALREQGGSGKRLRSWGVASAVLVILGLLYVGNSWFADAVTDVGLFSADATGAGDGDCLHYGRARKWIEVPCWSAATDRKVKLVLTESEVPQFSKPFRNYCEEYYGFSESIAVYHGSELWLLCISKQP